MNEQQNHPEYQYLNLLKDILENGSVKHDHNTGNALTSVFGRQIRFDLSQGFPLLTTKRVYWKGVLHELLWFLTGKSNIKYLVDNDVHIWDDYPYKTYKKEVEKDSLPDMSPEEFIEKIKSDNQFAARAYLKAIKREGLRDMTQQEFIDKIKTDSSFAEKWGELPYIYGQLWRRWPAENGRTIDQIAWIIDELKNYPGRKHHVFSVWNPEHLYSMALPGQALAYPLCHILVHFNVNNGKLSCQLYQRSADMFLGVPFNIASYALLTMIIAHLTGHQPGEFVHTFGDAHIYQNHFEQVKEQLTREPKSFPTIKINPSVTNVDDIKAEHITLEGYDPHPTLKGDLTVAGGFDEKDRKGIFQK